MKYAIFSDIHGNIEAFQAALESMDRKGANRKIFLGDIVGYGANPNECIDLLRDNNHLALAGNHDYGVIGKTSLDRFNRYAKKAAIWTKKILSKNSRKYLMSLPVIEEFDSMTMVHSTPKEPETWHYIMNVDKAAKNFPFFDTQICFIGHSHRPIIVEMNPEGKISGGAATEMKIKPAHRYIINDGSVGQPRDSNSKGAYCLYDSEKGLANIIRFAYDIGSQQAKMRQVGLPEHLIDRIEHGK